MRSRSRHHLSELLRLPLASFRQNDFAPGREWPERSYQWHARGASIGVSKQCEVIKDCEWLRLRYAHQGEPRTQDIGLRYLPRHFGGFLVVAVCPGCWRQVRVLYFRRAFFCARCTRAIYASSSQSKATRALAQFQKLRERIRPGTWNAGLYYFPRRPKRMRRATYERLRDRAYEQLNRYHSNLDAVLCRVFARIAPESLAEILGEDSRTR